MTLTRTMRLAVVALGAAAVAAAIAIAQIGTASAGEIVCPKRTLCVFQNDNFGGQQVNIKKDGVSNKLAEKMNNEASSVINHRGKRAYLYDKKNGKGDKVCLSPGAESATLVFFNDVASSSKNTENKELCPI